MSLVTSSIVFVVCTICRHSFYVDFVENLPEKCPECNNVKKTKESEETKILDVKYCKGCSDDFYNTSKNSIEGICWSRKTAKMILRKEVHIDQVPPWNQKAKELPSCYKRPKYVYVNPDQTH